MAPTVSAPSCPAIAFGGYARRATVGSREAVGAAVDELIPKVTIELWRSDAVVLFDWLTSTDLNDVPADHPAVKQALTDLLSRLEETAIPYGASGQGLTGDEIDAARVDVSQDMGW